MIQGEPRRPRVAQRVRSRRAPARIAKALVFVGHDGWDEVSGVVPQAQVAECGDKKPAVHRSQSMLQETDTLSMW